MLVNCVMNLFISSGRYTDLPIVFSFSQGIPSLAFRATISSAEISTFPIPLFFATTIFSSFVKDFTRMPTCFDGAVDVANDICFLIMVFLLCFVLSQQSLDIFIALGVDVKTAG